MGLADLIRAEQARMTGVSYKAMHARLSRLRGPASSHECANLCGKQAAEWAYVGATGTHSDDPLDYVALCILCHRILDDSLPPNPNTERTHCRRGHEFTEENTYTYRGRRQCKACRRLTWRLRQCAQLSS